jgi:hypothetical protein
MITVILSIAEPGRLRMEAGRVDFAAVPVRTVADYRCNPDGLLRFEDVQTLSAELARGAANGRIGRYEWRRA